MSTMPCPTESQEQQWLMQWAELQKSVHPELQLLFHIPNEGLRHPATGRRMIAEGMKSGVPDLMLPVPRGGYHGLFIEMKRLKGGVVSDSQKGWLAALRKQGYRCEVCRGYEAAVTVIRDYLGGK